MYATQFNQSVIKEIHNRTVVFFVSGLFYDIIKMQFQTQKSSIFYFPYRSDVFAAMFDQPMTESLENIVKIEDTEPHILEKFLKWT